MSYSDVGTAVGAGKVGDWSRYLIFVALWTPQGFLLHRRNGVTLASGNKALPLFSCIPLRGNGPGTLPNGGLQPPGWDTLL